MVHENRGLNPYIEDVARRLAVVGFLALAPDGLTSLGGYPGDDETGKQMQRRLEPGKLRQDFIAGYHYLKQRDDCSGKVGVVGFCYGGGWPTHGRAPAPAGGRGSLLRPAGRRQAIYRLRPPERQPRVPQRHHPRYDEAAAKPAWQRTIAFLKRHLD